MSKRVKAGKQAIRRTTLKRGGQTMFSITMLSLLVIGVLVGFELFGSMGRSKAEIRISSLVQAAPKVHIVLEYDYQDVLGFPTAHKEQTL